MSKFSHFEVKKLCFKWSFNSISGNRGPLFSPLFGGFCPRVYGQGVLSGALCPGSLCARTINNVAMELKAIQTRHIYIKHPISGKVKEPSFKTNFY